MMVQPKLTLKLSQKQILTPGLVQMVTVLALNRLELKDMINQELVENPVLEETLEEESQTAEDRTAEELDLEVERQLDPADRELRQALDAVEAGDSLSLGEMAPEIRELEADPAAFAAGATDGAVVAETTEPVVEPSKDPFDEIDFDSF